MRLQIRLADLCGQCSTIRMATLYLVLCNIKNCLYSVVKGDNHRIINVSVTAEHNFSEI
jgi:hypothetical protein